MSEHNGSENSTDSGPEEETGETTFDRGSALSLFHSDRLEDMLALFSALAVALYVYLNY